jgi:hypothetical protein
VAIQDSSNTHPAIFSNFISCPRVGFSALCPTERMLQSRNIYTNGMLTDRSGSWEDRMNFRISGIRQSFLIIFSVQISVLQVGCALASNAPEQPGFVAVEAIHFPRSAIVRLEEDGRIVFFYPVSGDGYIGEAYSVYGPDNPRYREVRDALGDIPVGQLVGVPEALQDPME